MGISEWVAEHGSGWLWVFLAAMSVVVGLMLVVPWAAFRGQGWVYRVRTRGPNARYRGARRMGKPRGPDTSARGVAPVMDREAWRTPSGSWRMVDTGSHPKHHRAEDEPGADTRLLHPGYQRPAGRARVTPPDIPAGTEEGERDEPRRYALGAGAWPEWRVSA